MIQFAMVVVVGFLLAMSVIFIIIELRSRFDRSFILFGVNIVLLVLFCFIDIELQPKFMTIGWTKIQHVIAAFFPVMLLWYLMTIVGRVLARTLWALAIAGLLFSFSMIGNTMFTGEGEKLAGTIFYDVLYVPFMVGSIFGITGFLFFHYVKSTGRIKADLGWHLIGLGILGIFGILEMINLMIGHRIFRNVPSLVVVGVLVYSLIVTAVFTNRLSVIIKNRENTFSKLQEAYHELDQVRPLMRAGQSAALFAHEVKNKSFGIALLLNSIRRNTLPPAVAAVLDKCASIASAISRLGREVLAQTEESASFKTPFAIRQCVDEAAGIALRERPDAIAFDVSLTDEVVVRGDGLKLRSVFDILFTNSIQAGARRVRISAVTGNGLAAITVEDDGQGCDRNTLDSLFTPFFTTKQDRFGTGLGLSIAHNVVQNHGGSISAYSKNLFGSGETGMIFCIVLPSPNAHPPAPADGPEILVIEEGLSLQLPVLYRILSNVRAHYRRLSPDKTGLPEIPSGATVLCSAKTAGLPETADPVLIVPEIPLPAVRENGPGAVAAFTEASALESFFGKTTSPSSRSVPLHDALIITGD